MMSEVRKSGWQAYREASDEQRRKLLIEVLRRLLWQPIRRVLRTKRRRVQRPHWQRPQSSPTNLATVPTFEITPRSPPELLITIQPRAP